MDRDTKNDEVLPVDMPKDATDSQCLSGFKLYSILSGIMIATILISLDVSIIATAIPAITSQHAATDIAWYGAAYSLTMSALQPLSGKIATIFSLRWSFLIFFAIFLLGSLLCGVANSSHMFIVGRAVAGIGGAGVVLGALSVIVLVTPATQRPLFTGLITSLYAVGTVIAPIIGGAFTSHVFLALQWGGKDYPWNSATVIGLFVGFGTLMLVFVLWELHKGKEAMIPFELLQEYSVVLSIIFTFLFMGSFVVPVYYLPEWFQIVRNASPMRSGVMLLPSAVT